jgi:hypothetical protein
VEALERPIAGIVVVSGLCSLLLAFVFAVFLGTAGRATGTVLEITPENHCAYIRPRDRMRESQCSTWYSAYVEYKEPSGAPHYTRLPAGWASGRDQPVSKASLHPGAVVPMSYSRPAPNWAYREGLASVFEAFWWWARWPMAGLVGASVFWITVHLQLAWRGQSRESAPDSRSSPRRGR